MKNFKFDYTFSFSPIQNQYTQVMMFDHLSDRQDSFSILIDDSALSVDGFSNVPSYSADLVDLAIAIHAVDRLIKRQGNKSLSFSVKVPIRNCEHFVDRDVASLLAKVLEWYTNDYWYFEFSQRDVLGRDVEMESQFPWRNLPSKNVEVALWSGGLDSLSGLYTRLSNNLETYHVLVGTGSNSHVHKKQELIARAIDQSFPGKTRLIQIPYRWSNTPLSEKSFGQRSRGLVFMLIGSACAYRIGFNSLFVYENGVGAINLPYSKAEVGVDHAKSVHPLSLLRVGELVSTILNTRFQFNNPFWLWTKAQMVKSLLANDDIGLIKLSSSCDRARRLQRGITQCGMCTSCLLRRQSLAALKIDDPSLYENNSHINKHAPHLCAMQFQVNRIRELLEHDDPWLSLSKEYHDLDDIVDQISRQDGQEILDLRQQVIKLYSRYVDEWKLFEEYIEKNASSDVVTYASSQ
ncbi:MAG: 7-cyano-7-deazaguanine synthase [Anaerolineales bacterium]|nr:7-cyano-7-deazaguanine synthase [Anaerolineales bacterium]